MRISSYIQISSSYARCSFRPSYQYSISFTRRYYCHYCVCITKFTLLSCCAVFQFRSLSVVAFSVCYKQQTLFCSWIFQFYPFRFEISTSSLRRCPVPSIIYDNNLRTFRIYALRFTRTEYDCDIFRGRNLSTPRLLCPRGQPRGDRSRDVSSDMSFDKEKKIIYNI